MELKEQLTQALTESIAETFTTVLSLAPMISSGPCAIPSDKMEKPILASIGIAGALEGSLVLSFSGIDACKITAKMLGIDCTEVSQDVLDASGEIANILAGGLKTRTEPDGIKFEISIPTVIKSADPLSVVKLNKTDIVELCISCDDMYFSVKLFYVLRADKGIGAFDKQEKKESASSALKELIK